MIPSVITAKAANDCHFKTGQRKSRRAFAGAAEKASPVPRPAEIPRLGLDVIYLQAKKWDGNVGRPEIQKFVGALHGKRAKKGVFITTGSFSAEAKEYASGIDAKVVLIDGQQLASLMIDFNLGVSLVTAYEVKQIDSDYFSEE